MAHPFKLNLMLSDGHWKPFHRLIEDRRKSVDDAFVWLVARGYKVSRSTVGYYRLNHLNRSLHAIRGAMKGKTDGQLRSTLARRSKLLSRRDLIIISALGELLAGAAAEPGGRKTVPGGKRSKAFKGR